MTRRCSHCCANGHNSRTCPVRSSGAGIGGGGGGVRLFGVRLTEAGAMKKSASMGCLSHYYHSSSPSLSPAASAQASPSGGGGGGTNTTSNRDAGGDDGRDPGRASGYASDDPSRASCSSGCRIERKKGTPWTEEEHRKFLMGLQRLGKGDWRGIARNFVVSRTPTQVASHAQKYFIRQSNSSRRKRRASLFDMAPDMPMDQDQIPIVEEQQMLPFPSDQESPTAQKLLLPSLNSTPDEESATAEVVMKTPGPDAEESNTISSSNSNSSLSLHPMVPAFYPAFIPLPVNFWPATLITTPVEEGGAMSKEAPKVLKPTPILPETTVHVDELVGLSNLTLGERASTLSECIEPSVLSSKLLSASASGHSAFHPNPVVAASADLNRSNGNTVIHAV